MGKHSRPNQNKTLGDYGSPYYPVQLNTTWRQPNISFVYETSPTFRWLKKEKEEEKIAIC
jgi:hypothetical protein